MQLKKITVITIIIAMCLSTVTAFGAQLPRPGISAGSGIAIDGDTGKVLYSKNSHTRRDPISTTKLLTALVVVEHLDLDQEVTISTTTANTPGSSMYLRAGEKVRVLDLLYGALLPSGNDAAVALAKETAGTTRNFAVLMNHKARELGCVDSRFSNPQGWKASTHYSSAYDMARIARAALNDDLIKEICSTEGYRIPKTNKRNSRMIYTTNSFVAKKVYAKSGVFAGKTGTWDVYNSALVSACERNGKVVYSVVLRDYMSNRYSTTNKILNYSYSKLF